MPLVTKIRYFIFHDDGYCGLVGDRQFFVEEQMTTREQAEIGDNILIILDAECSISEVPIHGSRSRLICSWDFICPIRRVHGFI